MDDDQRRDAFHSALVTEHFVLQSAASATINEGGSRSSLYVLSLSSSLVALGFAAQASEDAFAPFAAAVLPTMFLLGCFTVVRLVDTSIENMSCQRRIARIRQYYAGLLPEAPEYFPGTDVAEGQSQDMLGVRYTRSSILFTMASMIGTVNAVLGGTMVALVAEAGFGLDRAVALALAVCTAIALLAAALMYERTRFARAFPD